MSKVNINTLFYFILLLSYIHFYTILLQFTFDGITPGGGEGEVVTRCAVATRKFTAILHDYSIYISSDAFILMRVIYKVIQQLKTVLMMYYMIQYMWDIVR